MGAKRIDNKITLSQGLQRDPALYFRLTPAASAWVDSQLHGWRRLSPWHAAQAKLWELIVSELRFINKQFVFDCSKVFGLVTTFGYIIIITLLK